MLDLDHWLICPVQSAENEFRWIYKVKVAQIKLGLDLVKSQGLYRLEINICKSKAQCNADVDWIMKYLRLTAWYFKKEKDIASARNTLKNVHKLSKISILSRKFSDCLKSFPSFLKVWDVAAASSAESNEGEKKKPPSEPNVQIFSWNAN